MPRTERLELRLPREEDRERFVELFGDDDFMVFSGVLDEEAANRRFDGMMARAAEIPFAKQPVIERSTGIILGYSGVNAFEFEGRDRLECGYRLVPEARGQGYATEAGLALLEVADRTFEGEILAMIDPRNVPSQNVVAKLGFSFWKKAVVGGFLVNLYRREVPLRARTSGPLKRFSSRLYGPELVRRRNSSETAKCCLT